jgi:hypothetical protein
VADDERLHGRRTFAGGGGGPVGRRSRSRGRPLRLRRVSGPNHETRIWWGGGKQRREG